MIKTDKRSIFIIILILTTVIVHLIQVWRYFPNNISSIYRSYFSDILLPFTFYFILSISKNLKIPKEPLILFISVFGFCTLIEILQKYGIYILGKTYDPVDIIMYFIGSCLGLVVDIVIFKKKMITRKEKKIVEQ